MRPNCVVSLSLEKIQEPNKTPTIRRHWRCFPAMLAWRPLLCRCVSSALALECARALQSLSSVFFHLRSPLSSFTHLSGLPHPGDGARQPFVPHTHTLSLHLSFFFFLSMLSGTHSLSRTRTHAHIQTHPHGPAGWGIHSLGLTKTLMCGAAERQQQGRTRCEEAQQRREAALKTASRGE